MITIGVLGLAIAGIPSVGGATAPDGAVKLRVSPSSSLMDVPLTISVHGLKAKASATLRVTSPDVNGVAFTSEATFRANGDGVIDSAKVAPLSGSYSGVLPMGLITSMATASGVGFYFWGADPRPFTFTATSQGHRAASATVKRYLTKRGATRVPVTVEQAGFVGDLWQPAPGTVKKPAVLRFGGSEGGHKGQLLGALLALHGHPTLDIGYFNEPGLPATLSSIPLEYFTHALEWLGRQPNVDARQIYVMGTSRGSEAALLLGAHFPDLVAGVIAIVPSNVALCTPTCDGPAWTLNGQPLPYTSQFNNPAPTDNPDAVIPVERVRGPTLLLCGGADQVWHSCDYAKAITQRLDANRAARPHTLLSYPDAGHGVGVLVPYEPGSGSSANATFLNATGQLINSAGATPEANSIALAKIWPRVLDFLAKPTSK